MSDRSLLLQTVRQLLATAHGLLDQVLASEGGAAPRGLALSPQASPAPGTPGAPRRRGRPPKNPIATAASEAAPPPSADAASAEAPVKRRRRNPAAGRAAKSRWEAMSPEERAERVRKMQAARKPKSRG